MFSCLVKLVSLLLICWCLPLPPPPLSIQRPRPSFVLNHLTLNVSPVLNVSWGFWAFAVLHLRIEFSFLFKQTFLMLWVEFDPTVWFSCKIHTSLQKMFSPSFLRHVRLSDPSSGESAGSCGPSLSLWGLKFELQTTSSCSDIAKETKKPWQWGHSLMGHYRIHK